MSIKEKTGLKLNKTRPFSVFGGFLLVILLFSVLAIVYYPTILEAEKADTQVIDPRVLTIGFIILALILIFRVYNLYTSLIVCYIYP